MDWFKKKKETAVMQLGILCGNPVENSEQGVHDALECVFAHGSYADGAKAVMIVSQWMWANCEEAYHSEKPGGAGRATALRQMPSIITTN